MQPGGNVDTGIRIRKGDIIDLSVSGEYQHGTDQTLTFEGDKNANVSTDYNLQNAAPRSLVGWIGTETEQDNYFQISKTDSVTADKNGSLYFAVNNGKDDSADNRGDFIVTVTLIRPAMPGNSPIKIGSIVNLQNRYPNAGGYLDAWGQVWSKPEFSKVPTETMFVSTHYNPNRDNGSGSWEIVSATGKSNGEILVVGDKVHLKNRYPNAGYLDSCGFVKHLPVYKDFLDQTGAVFTTKSSNRDNGTGIWIVRSAAKYDGSPIIEGDSIALKNDFYSVQKGKIFEGGFLNVAGYVKDIPAFDDYDGSRLVFTQEASTIHTDPDIWTITISKAVLK